MIFLSIFVCADDVVLIDTIFSVQIDLIFHFICVRFRAGFDLDFKRNLFHATEIGIHFD